MEEEKQVENKATVFDAKKTRRAVITSAAQVGVTTAAVTVLLGAATKPATASALYDPAGAGPVGPIDSEVNDDTTNHNGDVPQGNTLFGNGVPDDVAAP